MLRDQAWDEAVHVVRGDLHGLGPVREDLVQRWSESHRGYHDLQHLDEVVAALADLRESTLTRSTDWAVVVLAAWFHDAVYDIDRAADNERRSAHLAQEVLSVNGIGTAAVDVVTGLIEASATHDVADTSGPQAAFHDADLWILGSPPARFDDYCAAVRREYAAVPDSAYARGRADILTPFLDRDSVYRTDRARQLWEDAARLNLARELERLSALG